VTTLRYMLDTDTVSYLVKRRFPSIEARLEMLEPDAYGISVVTRSEMLFGLHLASPALRSFDVTQLFLNHVRTLKWDEDAADVHARLRAELQKSGKQMSSLDLMIAAHAIALRVTLVTNNLRHFGRLQPELTVENWVAGS
jgi:tRNA(fMet)-specific endonuclease VapC